jgi:hypothetical protein
MSSEGKVFKNNFYVSRIILEHLLEERNDPRAVRSLKIAEDSNDYRRICRSLKRRSGDVDFVDKIDGKKLNRFVPAAAE